MTMSNDPWADDCLDRKRFGELLLACLQSEAVFSDEAFVVAVTGKFGAGKSHFLRMWKDELLQREKAHPGSSPAVVTLNAWESDFSGEPLLALVSEISNHLAKSTKDRAVDELKRGVAGFIGGTGKILFGAAANYVDDKTGIALEDVVDAVKDGASGGDLERRSKKLFSDFEARRNSLERLRESMGKFIESHSTVKGNDELKLVLIIDELDRCHPRYAIEFLEALKHAFNVKGLAIVLGVDWEQLGCTARGLFGAGLDVDEYFRKFIRRRIQLPSPNLRGAIAISEKLTKAYFPSGGGDNVGVYEFIRRREGDPSRLLGAYSHILGLTPRQCYSSAHVLSFYYRAGSGGPRWEMYSVDLFLVSLSVGNPIGFESVLKCEEDPVPALVFLKSLQLAARLEYYNGEFIEARILGTLRSESNANNFSEKAAKAGFTLARPKENQMEETEIGKVLNRRFQGRNSYSATVARSLLELESFLH